MSQNNPASVRQILDKTLYVHDTLSEQANKADTEEKMQEIKEAIVGNMLGSYFTLLHYLADKEDANKPLIVIPGTH